MTDTAVTHPKFHHVNLKTTRLQEMIDWYGEVVGTEVVSQDATGAWLSNDGANHRVALLAFPGFADTRRRRRARACKTARSSSPASRSSTAAICGCASGGSRRRSVSATG